MSRESESGTPAPPVTEGGWCHIPSTFAAEIMGAAGFDWCCIDTQHGFIDDGQVVDMVRALELGGTDAYVRVRGVDPFGIGTALDSGATGVIVPSVRSPEEARIAVAACRYQPAGTRSFGTTRTKLYPARLAAQHLDPRCFVMIETVSALQAVDEIAAIPGLTGLFVGPHDLMLDLETDEEGLRPAIRRVGEACAAAGVEVGAFCGPIDRSLWIDNGYTFLAVTSDSTLLLAAAKAASAR